MRVKRVIAVLFAVALVFTPLISFAQESTAVEEMTQTPTVVQPNIIITELQANGLTAEKEFIELYNAGEQAADLAQIKLERATSTATSETSWQNLITITALSGELASGEYLVIAHRDYLTLNAGARYSSNLSNSGGHIRVIWDDPSTELVEKYELDKLGWGTAAMPETLPAVATAAGSSLQRCLLETYEYDDSNNNSLDFYEFAETTLGALSQDCSPEIIVEPPEEEPEETETPEENEEAEEPTELEPTEPEPTINLMPVQITELLPNPASPLTDASDEYVELYNPNDVNIELDGWKLETGSNFSYRVFLKEKVIPAKGYLVIKSGDTNLTLSNTAGAARLVNADDELQSISDTYQDADDGEAWSFIAGVWQWTSTPTEGLPNILVAAPVPAVKAASTKKASAAKKTAAKKKTAAAKKTTKKPKADTAARSVFEEPPTDGKLLPVNPAVLAVVGLTALGYSLYEYRHDLRNTVERLRRHREIRRATRSQA
ncbi:MAG: lamin tail domain-containing protein [bacterium]|nr:lamin tail domain-containing protein [bacterium]